MSLQIRDITSEDLALYGETIAMLERLGEDRDARRLVFDNVVRLVRADHAASYVWSERARRFKDGLIHNMDPANIRRYDEWYQYRDPHTLKLRARRRATLVEEVTPYDELRRTEFYNEFLKRDGLHHGVNLFLFDGDVDLGDFRLWRSARSPDFGEREIMLLNALAPHLRQALVRGQQRYDRLTAREREIAGLVARGCRDRDIGRLLGIGFSTVRTHINKAMEKRGVANRAELAASVIRDRGGLAS